MTPRHLPKVGDVVSLPGWGPCEIEHLSSFGARVRPLRHERVTGTNHKTGQPFDFRRRPRAVTVAAAAVGYTQ